jgi:hypothetical protein
VDAVIKAPLAGAVLDEQPGTGVPGGLSVPPFLEQAVNNTDAAKT